jgi:methylase of polypeptide subunit release factors
MVGEVAQHALEREQALPARLVVRAKQEEPLATLVALFVLGQTVERRHLDRAVPSVRSAGLEALGLVEAAGDEVRPRVDLRPYAAVDALGEADWWLVSDLAELATGKPLEPDHVLGVGGASMTLARSTIRTPAGRVLDLGTGCGVQALHAARHTDSVTGTDISSRALGMARLNWALNQESTPFDTRLGSLLEPVEHERFDLVISNPPFVITPRAIARPTYEYRDGGLVGDELVQRLVIDVGSVLAPGGVAQFLGNWEHRRGSHWRERVGAWLDEAGLDGWIVQREVQDPAEYAETWIRDAGQHLSPHADELYAAWLADFESRAVEAVGFGLITLRRSSTGLRRLEERRGGPGLPSGAEIAAGLAAHDWLTARDDESLLAARLVVAPDVTEERHLMPGAEEPTVILLRQGGGAGRVVQASTPLAGLVGASDGELSVGQIVGALAVLLESSEGELTAELLPVVRDLVADGLLTPAEP